MTKYLLINRKIIGKINFNFFYSNKLIFNKNKK